ncbi:MAG: FAD-dependent oxidoreductase [Acidobacteria bacterium]|nr:FAD-dependent oxidoreductase [Acidobacteriota bacterium]
MIGTRNLILGAGLAGLSAAASLPREETLVLEREGEVGGLCRSREVDGFTFDCTGHLLHLKDPGIRDLVHSLLPRCFASVERKSLIYSKGVYTGYPFQANTYGLPREVIRECVLGFVEALLRRGESEERPESNFREWVLSTFGDGIARHFLFPYNEKLYRVDLNEMECGWVSWSIPRPSLDEVVRGSLGMEVKGLGYNPQFLYPRRGGIDAIPRALQTRCGEIRLKAEVRSLDLLARRVRLESGEEIGYERLLSTLPLDGLLRMLNPLPEPALGKARGKLRAVRVVNINLGVDRPAVLPGHWVYFPEAQFPFYRVGSPTNYSSGVAPVGCSSLYVEVARRRDEPLDEETLVEEVLEALRRVEILRSGDRIVAREVLVLDPAYVVYDHFRQQALPSILRILERYGVISTGRFGAWEYGSMESALKQGRAAAERLDGGERVSAGGRG